MAYFRRNEEMEETRQQPTVRPGEEYGETPDYVESDYDDGFDDPAEEPEEEISEEEKQAIRKKRFRLMSGAGNLTAVIAGTAAILILLALLMNMIGFVINDADRNFTLFQTKF